IRDSEKALEIPDLIREGTTQYGMQSFDQSIMHWYNKGVISKEAALFYSSNPSEFELRLSGVEGTSDRTFSDQIGGGESGSLGGGV
ncbi:MAG: type IV pili twitching motility protein PilT, partial [Gemmatimonadetes bacterium]|nr:type IV pili twitching motility protein PilT [Gemmatimonadota bacterium]